MSFNEVRELNRVIAVKVLHPSDSGEVPLQSREIIGQARRYHVSQSQSSPAPVQALVEVVSANDVVGGYDERTPRIPQLELEFPLLVQRTASHDHPSRLQYSEVADDELRHVRHEDADPVALAETEGYQRGRKPGREVVQLG